MSTPSFVGRERELAAMTGWLDDAVAERGAIALVSGEPGIGKSRLLETVAARATDRGFAVAWGRAWEVSSAPPYWPWIEALRALAARGHDGSGLALLDRSAAPADPFALYDAVVGFLRAVATKEPLVVVLDDLHAADPSSLQLAELVAPQLRTMRAALFGSYRDVEARLSPVVEAALARLGRRGETLRLPRLDVGNVGELVHEAIGKPDPETARMIHDASEGNPLFVRELLALLAARGAASGDVPAGVRAVIRERLSLLAPATVALLQAAAVVGRTFGVALAAEVAGVTASALEDAIGEAAAADVVAAIEPGRYRFSHAMVAETLATTLAPAVGAKLHRRAAETLARQHADDPAAPFAEIAHHWLAVGVDAGGEALVATERAANQAEGRVAFADAAEHYERALGVLASHAPGDARRRAEYLIKQGENLVRGGERERAKAPCMAACEVAASLGDPALYARAALAYGADVAVAVIDPTLVHLLEQALSRFPAADAATAETVALRAKVMARLAAARQPALDTRGPVALAGDAIAMARRLGDPVVLYDVLFSAIGALTDFERPEIRGPLNAEVVRMAAAAGDRARQLRSLQRLAFDMIDLGDLAGFERTVNEYSVIGEATGQLRYTWVPLLFRAMQAHWEGRSDDDRRLADQAFAIREQLGDSQAQAMTRIRRSMAYGVAAADVDEVAFAMTGGSEAFIALVRAAVHAGAGRRDDARRELELVRLDQVFPDYLHIHGLAMVARVAWVLRDRELAATIEERLAVEHGRPMMITSFGFLMEDMFDAMRMRTAAVLGKFDEAELHARDALELCGKLNAKRHADTIRADLDVIRAELGRASSSPVPVRKAAQIVAAQEGEFWTVRGLGELCRIKDSRGMQMLARLLASPHQELHALDLAGAELVDGGDAGEVIDKDARDAYRDRLRGLQAELAEAEDWNDAGRRERITDEIEVLTGQLTGAYGLGGRERRTGVASERARQNVRRRIADAMHRIADASPAIGKHLEVAIRTGTTCTYNPDR